MRVVHFLGYQGSGKTRTVSYVVKELGGRNLRVGTLKHVHEQGFTLDARGKDSWVHARSGAGLVVVVSPGEVATIEKRSTGRMRMGEVLQVFRKKGVEYLLVEGFSGEFSGRSDTLRVICARSTTDARDLMGVHKNVLCVIGELRDAPDRRTIEGVPVLRLPEDGPKLLRLLVQNRTRRDLQPHAGGSLQRIQTPSGRQASSG